MHKIITDPLHSLTKLTNRLSLPIISTEGGLNAFILLSLLGNLLVIGRTFQFFDFIFPTYYPTTALIIKSLLVIWLVITLLIAYRRNQIYLSLVQLLISSFILRCFLTFGIFEMTHLCISWALLFSIVVKKNIHEKDGIAYSLGVLGLFFTVVFFGLIFFYSGIDKLIDPAWQNGMGFKQFVELEWVLNPPIREFFLSSPIPLKLGNYFTLLTECGFLICIIFRGLRKLGFILYFLLAVQLFFPFNIFLIGYFAVIFLVPVYLISFSKNPLLKYRSSRSLILPWFTITIVTLALLANLIRWINTEQAKLRYVVEHDQSDPLLDNHFYFDDLKSKPESVLSEVVKIFHLSEIKKPHKFLGNRILRYGPVALFSSKHTVGMFAYKLRFYTEDGNLKEPIVFFSNDGYRGTFDQQFFMLNIFQSSLYRITDLIYRINYEQPANYSELVTLTYRRVLSPLIKTSLKYTDQAEDFVKATVSVYSLGNDCYDEHEVSKWVDFIEIDLISSEINIKKLDISSCQQGRYYQLKNYYQRTFKSNWN